MRGCIVVVAQAVPPAELDYFTASNGRGSETRFALAIRLL
jgi:hypothetical protein